MLSVCDPCSNIVSMCAQITVNPRGPDAGIPPNMAIRTLTCKYILYSISASRSKNQCTYTCIYFVASEFTFYLSADACQK